MEIGHTIKSITTGMPVLFTGGQPRERAGAQRLTRANRDLQVGEQMMVQSAAFQESGPIPTTYSADGKQISPPLSWSAPPDGTTSIALIVEDPDAPTPMPFVHWLLYNIPPHVRQLPEDVGHDKIAHSVSGALQGLNSNMKIGWTGMAPPKGDTPHHYHFQLFALDRVLNLKPGAGRSALVEAMRGHIVGRGEVVGTYQR